jgi:hypothetical protein
MRYSSYQSIITNKLHLNYKLKRQKLTIYEFWHANTGCSMVLNVKQKLQTLSPQLWHDNMVVGGTKV